MTADMIAQGVSNTLWALAKLDIGMPASWSRHCSAARSSVDRHYDSRGVEHPVALATLELEVAGELQTALSSRPQAVAPT